MASSPGNAHKLQRVQRLAITRVAPTCQGTPTAGLEVIPGVPPLALYVQFLATASYSRLHLKPNVHWTGQNGTTLGHINWLKLVALTLPDREFQDRCIQYY
jgi:hypothetical protein